MTETDTNLLDAVTNPDTPRIRFSVRVKAVEYGDDRTFHEWRVVMHSGGNIVGVEDGPNRTHDTPEASRRAGWDRVRQLRTHKLFIVPITKIDIKVGEGHSCEACAISQALWRNQERIGLSKHEFGFRVEPYGAFVDVEGIVLGQQFRPFGPTLATGERNMPDIAYEWRGKLYTESMYEWAIHFDEYDDSRNTTLAEWREENGYTDGETPWCPTTGSFVLNLSEMTPAK
jgi:hypothetical protein